MKAKLILIISICLIIYSCKVENKSMEEKLLTPFELNENTTASYDEIINYYQQLAQRNKFITIEEAGTTDVGKPLHLVKISNQKHSENKVTLFINNGIHPGEPCGIDASMMFVRDITESDSLRFFLENIDIILIPVYNVGGILNRGSYSRANQNGPQSYGFRGNAKNLDLNRDFIKADSKNAQSFQKIFTKYNPQIMVDTHTSNGADYQYTMTLIATQKDKLTPSQKRLLEESMLPFLYKSMEDVGYGMTPYVNANGTPDTGIYGFLDSPRYSSGFAALHHCVSFMPETHMLKPFKDRVLSTYQFLMSILDYTHQHAEEIIDSQREAIEYYSQLEEAPIDWKLNQSLVDSLVFKGYEAKYKKSEVSSDLRLYYDRNEAFARDIPYYNAYDVAQTVRIPKAYYIPQAYDAVIERLKNNGVQLERIEKDTLMRGSYSYISSYEDLPAYEGHYLHRKIMIDQKVSEKVFYAGDYKINTKQRARRFIIETLEPNAPDSYFAWNFFDGILMQKEYFSDYVFEDLAAGLLAENTELKQRYHEAIMQNPELDTNAAMALDWIYKQSVYFEPSYKQYPIWRKF